MPYIITMKRPDPVAKDQSKHRDSTGELRYSADDSLAYPGPTGVRSPDAYETRRAVATLEEARLLTYAQRMGDPSETWHWCGESGGVFGPLPDGTVIEVEQISWPELGERAGRPYRFAEYEQVVDAFNAAV